MLEELAHGARDPDKPGLYANYCFVLARADIVPERECVGREAERGRSRRRRGRGRARRAGRGQDQHADQEPRDASADNRGKGTLAPQVASTVMGGRHIVKRRPARVDRV